MPQQNALTEETPCPNTEEYLQQKDVRTKKDAIQANENALQTEEDARTRSAAPYNMDVQGWTRKEHGRAAEGAWHMDAWTDTYGNSYTSLSTRGCKSLKGYGI